MIVGIIARVSTDKQEKEGYSLQVQIKKGLDFATGQNWEFKIYQGSESGKSIEDRTILNKLISDIEAKEIGAVWVIESSRLERNLADSLKLRELFKKYNIQYFVNGVERKFESAEDKLSFNVQSSVNEFQREKIIEDSIRGKSARQNAGELACSFWACIRAELVKDFIKVEEIYRKNQLLEKETTR